MRTPPALATLMLCATLLLGTAHQASAALPPPTRQTSDPSPVQPANGAALSKRIFLPAVTRGPVAHVSAIELTQATQNAANTVPMVANRPTVARVYLKSAVPLSGQTITLSATRNGVALAGSPLSRTGARSWVAPDRLNPANSVNFLLPTTWLSGNVVLTARVMDGGEALARSVAFQPMAPLRVTIVPIRYIHAPNGKVYAPPTAVTFPASVQRMFPVPNVEVKFHAPFTYRGNVTAGASDRIASWNELLNLLLALKQSDGAAADVIYAGILPQSVANEYQLYFVGVGTSMRATLSFDMMLVTPHELGHALARSHAPCGDVIGTDPAYPYASGLIGEPGFDTSTSRVWDPASTTDLMSYCAEWVSDYTYVGMYQNQRSAVSALAEAVDAEGASTFTVMPQQAPVHDAVLVRALLGPGQDAELLPVYALRAPIENSPPQIGASFLTVAFVDGSGATLAAHPVAVIDAEEDGTHMRSLSSLLPAPPGPVAAIELRDGGTVLARRSLRSALLEESAPVIAADADAIHVSSAAGLPYLVRLSQAGRETTLALDVADGEFSVPLTDLPGGPAQIEVIAADTLDSANVESASRTLPLSLADTPPVVWIASPEAPAGGDGLVVAGYATDAEDDILQARWFVNGGEAGHGPFLQIAAAEQVLVPLNIELRAIDSAGQEAVARITVQPVQ